MAAMAATPTAAHRDTRCRAAGVRRIRDRVARSFHLERAIRGSKL
jgi:hypothetical protein